jgi:hypothetical protein
MKITTHYIFDWPAAYTFDMPKVMNWLRKRLVGRVLNVFAGKNKLPGAVNCDIDQALMPDFIIDAMELDFWFEPRSFDTAVIDPPYSMHQANVNYNGNSCHEITVVRDHLRKIVTKRLIWFGWTIPATPGFVKKEILLVGHGGSHNATICTVEDRLPRIDDFIETCTC